MFFLTNVGLAILDPSWRVRALVRMYIVAVVILVDKMEDDADHPHIVEFPSFREEPGRFCGAVLFNQTVDGRTLDNTFGPVNMDKIGLNNTAYAVAIFKKKKKDNSSSYRSFFASLFQMLGRKKTAIGLTISLIIGLVLWD